VYDIHWFIAINHLPSFRNSTALFYLLYFKERYSVPPHVISMLAN